MRAVVLYNPNSGRGRGQRVAEELRAVLEGRARVTLVATKKEPPEAFRDRLGAAVANADLLIVAGGDGTLHHALPALVGRVVPVYHLAMGTENLFAREFGMDGDPRTIRRAIERWRVVHVDVGMLRLGAYGGASPFVLMCSVGPDASVIRRLDQGRKGPISHWNYAVPMAAEVLLARPPRLTIEVDGQPIVEGRRGMVVVANSRQYAMRIDPARRASMRDGVLDVVFFPCRTGVGALAHVVRSRLGKQAKSAVYRQGREVSVQVVHRRPPLQVDGEHRPVIAGPLELRASVRAEALRVLLP